MKLVLNLLFFILFTFSLFLAHVQSSCHHKERSALIHFKISFSISKSVSIDPSAYPRTESWNSMKNESNCCLWNGIKCDEKSGHVIGLDLSSSYLHGSIKPNNSIFELIHLQTLNLADNHFSYSLIPSKIGCLSNLKYLNLSGAVFSGQVPIAISNLSKLISLDLSNNQDPLTRANMLRLQEPGLRTFLQNFTTLESINLNHVIISSQVPKVLANLTSLKHLQLEDCELRGSFPKGIFLLPNLQILNMAFNEGLGGHLPKFDNSSKLKALALESTRFSGKIPTSIGNVGALTALHFSFCSFHGSIPYSLSQLTKLTILDFTGNSFEGHIPISLSNLTQLSWLGLGFNNLTGEVPSGFTNFTNLMFLVLGKNNLYGSIPSIILGHQHLVAIDLHENNFASPVEFDLFLKQKQLEYLDLSDVKLIFRTTTHNNYSFPHFLDLALTRCNLAQFPTFLHNQTKLQVLELPYNQIEGPLRVPSPSSLSVYNLAINALSGEIPTSICNATSINFIALEANFLSGKIPPCLWNLSKSIAMLTLDQNNLQGSIPNTFLSGCTLEMISLVDNQLQGQLPRTLANCSSLKVLDFGHNLINDTFPSWLGALPELQVLALGSNRLHGVLPIKIGLGFSKLRIIDLSNNKLTGNLSNELFLNWLAMGKQYQGQSSYMASTRTFTTLGSLVSITGEYVIEIKYKGREIDDYKVLNIFTSMDLSGNEFVGTIPDSIGNLMGLEALNLSRNNFTGTMPQSLGNLSNLESLDLSFNLLSGDIPQQLTKLTFLENFNASYNHLIGSIPQGNQFDTFGNDSFEGNIGLCGNPLSNKCGGSEAQSPSQPHLNSYDGDDEESLALVTWIVISMGYLSGLVVGVILGRIFAGRHHEWFVERFERRGQLNKGRARR